MQLASLVLASFVAALPAEPAAPPTADPAPVAPPAQADPGAAPAPVAQPAPEPPPPTEPAPVAAPAPAKKPFSFGVWGALPFGENWAPAISPVEASAQVNAPDQSYAFGIVGEYAVTPEIRIFLDGGMYTESSEVAKPGSNGVGFWVFEQMGYSGNHQIGPFEDGVRYFVDTTALRLGAAWTVPVGKMSGWLGATLGVYRWQATYGTPDRTGKYGQVSDTVTGFTLIGGVDMPLGDVATIGLFADVMAPGAEATMEDLFNDGWSWTTDHHVMGPYRIGVRLLTGM